MPFAKILHPLLVSIYGAKVTPSSVFLGLSSIAYSHEDDGSDDGSIKQSSGTSISTNEDEQNNVSLIAESEIFPHIDSIDLNIRNLGVSRRRTLF